MKECPHCKGKLEDGVGTRVRYSCGVCNLRWEENGVVRYWMDRTWVPGWALVPEGCLVVKGEL